MAAIAVASGATQQLRAVDGSGYFADVSPWTEAPVVYDANGTSYNRSNPSDPYNWAVTDVYGNQIKQNITTGTITDSVSRSIPTIASGPAGNINLCTPGATRTATWAVPGQTGQNGGTVSFQFCYSTVGITDIILPNGTTWKFAYESYTDQNYQDITGTELTQITLPTGGTIKYTWQTITKGAPKSAWRGIVSRTADANDGNGPQRWTYSWGTGFPGQRVLTITDPLLNSSKHTMQEFYFTLFSPV